MTADVLVDLRQNLARYVREQAPVAAVGAWNQEQRYPQEFFDGLATMGYLGIHLPEDLGGGGLGATAMAVVGEELGRGGLELAVNYGLTAFPSMTLVEFGTSELVSTLIPDTLQHRRRFAVGLSESQAGSDVAAIGTRARSTGSGFVVSGQKLWTSGAGVPRTVLQTLVRTSDGPRESSFSVLLIPLDADGVEVRRLPTVGRHILGTYEVTLDHVEVPAHHLVGALGDGWQVITSGLEIERVFAAAELAGCARSALDLTVQYVTDRKQFGQPIGSFQAVAHTLANLEASLQAARLLAYHAADLYDRGHSAIAAGSAAKLLCSELFQEITAAGMQFMGGAGYTTLHPMERLWREARSTTVSAGTSEMQRNIIARAMGLPIDRTRTPVVART